MFWSLLFSPPQSNAFVPPCASWTFVLLVFFSGKRTKDVSRKTHSSSSSCPFPKKKKKPMKKTGRLYDPCRLRPLPERLEPPPRPGKVERRRRLYPGAVWPRRRRRRCERGGGVPSKRHQQPVGRRRFVLVDFVRRPQRDHGVFLVPALWRGQTQVHRGPVCAFRERDGAGDLCAEGRFNFCVSFLKEYYVFFLQKDEKLNHFQNTRTHHTHTHTHTHTHNTSLTLRSPRGLRPWA